MTPLLEKSALPPRLWHRDFRLYFTARLVSMFGDMMMPAATAMTLNALGYDASGVGWALASWMLPFGLFVLFGGVLADRFSARRMMIGADAVRLAVQAGFAVMLLTGHANLLMFMVGGFVNGIATAMFQPGVSSVVPQVAADVNRANGVLRMAEGFTMIFGPATAAMIFAFTAPSAIFFVDAGTFAISGVALLLLRLRPVTKEESDDTSMLRNLVEGWREFSSRSWLWGVIVVWAVNGVFVFGPYIPLVSSIVTDADGKVAFGVLESALGVGSVLGGLLAIRVKPDRPLAGGALAMLFFPAAHLAVAAGLPLLVTSSITLFTGAAWAFWGVQWTTVVQTHIRPEILNRVYAYDVAGSVLAIPVGQAIAGPIASAAGARQVLGASGVIGILTALALIASPPIRNLRRAD